MCVSKGNPSGYVVRDVRWLGSTGRICALADEPVLHQSRTVFAPLFDCGIVPSCAALQSAILPGLTFAAPDPYISLLVSAPYRYVCPASSRAGELGVRPSA